MDLEPGTHVAQYVVERILGPGGMASAFRVRHEALGSRYALKLLDLTSETSAERLAGEGRIQAALRHPNIVSVLDVVERDGSPGLVMEYVDGPRSTRSSGPPADDPPGSRVARGIAEGACAPPTATGSCTGT